MDDDWNDWNVREQDSNFNPKVEYAKHHEFFTLELHHGGQFTEFPDIRYEGGNLTYIDKVNSECFSVIILNEMLISLGYSEEEIVTYHFKTPREDMDLGLRPLGNDSDALRLMKYAETTKVLEVYVTHLNTFPKNDVPPVELNDEDFIDESGDEGSDNYKSYESSGSDESDECSKHEDSDSDFIVDEDNLVEDVNVNDMDEFRSLVDYDISEPYEDSENFEDALENEIDPDEFDNQVESDNDTPLEQVVKDIRKKKKKSKQTVDVPFYIGQAFNDRETLTDVVKLHAVKSRRQLHISRNDFKRFRVICMGGNLTLSSCENKGDGTNVGGTLKRGRAHGGTQKLGGTSVKTKPKPKKKYPKPNCPWTLHISNKEKHGHWMVKTYIKEHTCLQTRVVNLCTVSWLAKQIEPTIRTNPSQPLRSLQADLQRKYQIQVTSNQVFRAKNMATRKIQGDFEAQYGILRDYAEELLRSDPGTTVKIDVEPGCNPNSPTRQFRRIYICLGALKKGFKACGRELLGLDGCFLKGPFLGQILTAVGVDGNNGIYPVAYALVEAETTATWTWFLELLGDDLDLAQGIHFTFLSDRQKGLIPALAKVFPSSEHRYCLRHIHENMKSTWRGDVFKNLLWECATATTIPAFDKAMKNILDEHKDLHDWLKQIPPKHWSRAYFSGNATCDMLLNNICEVFNKQLLQGRDKPIITCLEFIREYLMKKIVVVHRMQANCNGPLTPAATKLFQKIKDDASSCTVIWYGPNKYQVTGPHIIEQRIVMIDKRSCSCRRWDLTGMPCRHAVACIWNMGLHGLGDGIPEKYVDKAYWLETWKNVYANTIEPINGMDMWPTSACPTTLIAPKYHKQIGRPKIMRKKSAVEVEELKQKVSTSAKMPRHSNSLSCGICKAKGHNKRTCDKARIQHGAGSSGCAGTSGADAT